MARAKAPNGEGVPRKVIVNGKERWQVQFTLLDKNGNAILDGNGKPMRPSHRAATQKAAIAWRDQKKREAAAGSLTRPKTLTVPVIVDAYIATQCEGNKPNTMDGYRRAQGRIKADLKVKAEDLTPARTESFLRQVAAKAAGPGVVDGRASAKMAWNLLHAAMAWAQDGVDAGEYRIHKNMISRMKFPLGPTRKRREVPLDDAGAIIAASAGKPSQLIWRLFVATGMRRGEVTGLNVEHINVRRREIHIRQIASGRGGRDLRPDTKNNETRDLTDIPESIMNDLAELIKGRGPKEAVFRGPRSPRLSFATLREWMIRDTKAAGMDPTYTPHQFRHLFATEGLSNGMSISAVQEALGHSSPVTTVGTYGHGTRKATQALMQTVSSSIDLAVANAVANAQAIEAETMGENPAA